MYPMKYPIGEFTRLPFTIPIGSIIALDDGEIYRKALYLVKTMVSCRFSLKPIHCLLPQAPSIIFIDEIDAIGRKRGKGGFTGGLAGTTGAA